EPSDAWTELPDLPAGRDHLAAFHYDGAIYYTGGAPQGGGDTSSQGYRYDIAANRWEPADWVRGGYASEAAVLNGRVYTGDTDGSVFEIDMRRRTSRVIPPPNDRQRDHSQLVAFMGEIWVMGGRTPETNTVAIYDPVTERWRFGPPMVRAHAGYGAAVMGDAIVLGGGEVISQQPFRIEPAFEAYTAGQQFWRRLGDLPQSVHGFPGAVIGNRYYLISGAGRPATAEQVNGRVYSFEFAP
ncbi:MAG TPA: hypothetical protein VFL14_10715, partial [Xanthomonadales bacterium]|nr:hypothetical protein [Xanthomonadales bacterium]